MKSAVEGQSVNIIKKREMESELAKEKVTEPGWVVYRRIVHLVLGHAA